VGQFFYGVGTGVAPGVSHVDNYSADYFFNTVIFWGESIPDAVVNQSFCYGQSSNPAITLADQEASDTEYDNYIDEHGTIIVSGVGDSDGAPEAPSTCYNGIAVGCANGPSAVGPTLDNGRCKPDITAPNWATSFSAPLVSGAAAILVQAGTIGAGGTSAQIEADAVDPRTVKALLLNGANKQSVTFNRTPTSPLDPINGAGMLNVYNSYENLAAGFYSPSSTAMTGAVGGAHPADTISAPINSLQGWNFSSLTSSASADAYANYVFTPSAGASSYTFTATLVWERQYNDSETMSLGINNLDLYLYDATTNTLVDSSVSTVDNVQDVYDLNLTPGNRYDLEVLKKGGIPGVSSGVVSNSETYALAFNFAPQSAAPGQSIWSGPSGGNAALPSNWIGGVPELATDTADFAGAITAPATVTLTSNWTMGNILFDNSYSYTVATAANGPLTLDNGGPTATATITDAGGSHTIDAPIQLNSNLSVTVANAGNTLQITGNIYDSSTAGNAGLTLTGNGTLSLSGVNTYGGGTTVSSGTLIASSGQALPSGNAIVNNSSLVIQAGTAGSPVISGQISGSGGLAVGGAAKAYLQLAAGSGNSSQSSLTVAAGSTLDITNNSLTINYGSAAADPVAAIEADISSAYQGGTWGGTGITSSLAAASGHKYAIGYADGNQDSGGIASANQLVLQYALDGDAKLDGTVNFADLLIVAQNYGKTGQDWAHGDFNYDGVVNFPDLLIVVQNYGSSLSQNQSVMLGPEFGSQLQLAAVEIKAAINVPEPTGTGLLLVAGTGLLRRRRQRAAPAWA
jgi:autotransporter-associated beta strand protein